MRGPPQLQAGPLPGCLATSGGTLLAALSLLGFLTVVSMTGDLPLPPCGAAIHCPPPRPWQLSLFLFLKEQLKDIIIISSAFQMAL